MLAAGKAVIKPFLIIDKKTGRFFIGKGRKPGKFAALTLKLHMTTHHIRNPDARLYLIHEIFAKSHNIFLRVREQISESRLWIKFGAELPLNAGNVIAKVVAHFRPEFLNRLDEMLLFERLNPNIWAQLSTPSETTSRLDKGQASCFGTLR